MSDTSDQGRSKRHTEQVHDCADARAEIVLHVAETRPQYRENSAQFFGKFCDEMRCYWQQARRCHRADVIVAVTESEERTLSAQLASEEDARRTRELRHQQHPSTLRVLVRHRRRSPRDLLAPQLRI